MKVLRGIPQFLSMDVKILVLPTIIHGQIIQALDVPILSMDGTDPNASNYNSSATNNDGSCQYPNPTVL